MKTLNQSHSAEKCKRGFGLFKISTKLKGGLFRYIEKHSKSLAMPKKIKMGNPLVSHGFVCCIKKEKLKVGPFALT